MHIGVLFVAFLLAAVEAGPKTGKSRLGSSRGPSRGSGRGSSRGSSSGGLSTGVQCEKGGLFSATDESEATRNTMLQCLESFEGQDWEGKECGQRKWYKSGSMASRACYVACNTCMREAIDEGVTKVKCKPPASNLSSMCEMGFKKD